MRDGALPRARRDVGMERFVLELAPSAPPVRRRHRAACLLPLRSLVGEGAGPARRKFRAASRAARALRPRVALASRARGRSACSAGTLKKSRVARGTRARVVVRRPCRPPGARGPCVACNPAHGDFRTPGGTPKSPPALHVPLPYRVDPSLARQRVTRSGRWRLSRSVATFPPSRVGRYCAAGPLDVEPLVALVVRWWRGRGRPEHRIIGRRREQRGVSAGCGMFGARVASRCEPRRRAGGADRRRDLAILATTTCMLASVRAAAAIGATGGPTERTEMRRGGDVASRSVGGQGWSAAAPRCCIRRSNAGRWARARPPCRWVASGAH